MVCKALQGEWMRDWMPKTRQVYSITERIYYLYKVIVSLLDRNVIAKNLRALSPSEVSFLLFATNFF